jgi:hypothetical protein
MLLLPPYVQIFLNTNNIISVGFHFLFYLFLLFSIYDAANVLRRRLVNSIYRGIRWGLRQHRSIM